MATSYYNPYDFGNSSMGGPGNAIPGLAGAGTMGPGGQNYSNLPNQPLSGPGGPGMNASGVSTAAANAPNYGGAPGSGQMAAGGGMQGIATSIQGLIQSNNSLIQALNNLARSLGGGRPGGTPGTPGTPGSPQGAPNTTGVQNNRALQGGINSIGQFMSQFNGGNGAQGIGTMGNAMMNAGQFSNNAAMMRAGGLVAAGAAAIQVGDNFAGNRGQMASMNLATVKTRFGLENIGYGLAGDVNPYAGARVAHAETLARENLYRDTLIGSGQGSFGDFFQSFFKGSRMAYEQPIINEAVSKARKEEERDREKYTKAYRYAAVSSADTTTTYLEAQSRFKDITKGGATLKRRAAGLASLLGDAGTYIGMEKNVIDFFSNVAQVGRGQDGSSLMMDFTSTYNLSGPAYDRGTKGRSGPIRQNVYTSYALGRNPGSMTALLGTFADDLGMNVMEAGNMLNEVVATQGFVGVDFTETYDLHETTAAGKRSYGNSRSQGRVPKRRSATTGVRRKKPYKDQSKRGVDYDNEQYGDTLINLEAEAIIRRTQALRYAAGLDPAQRPNPAAVSIAAGAGTSGTGIQMLPIEVSEGVNPNFYRDYNIPFMDREIKAFKQRGIATSNIGLAGSLNAGGSGLSRAYADPGYAQAGTFGGFVLNAGLMQGLRGRGMASFINEFGTIGQMYANRGSEIVSQSFKSRAAQELGGIGARTFAAEAQGFLSYGMNMVGSAFAGASGVRQMGRVLSAGGQGIDQMQDMLGMNGMFGTSIMASLMADSDVGGDYFKALKKYESMGLFEMRERAKGMLGEEGLKYALTSDKIGQNTIDTFLNFSPSAPIDEPGLKRDLMSGSASQTAAESMADVARTFKAETFKLLKAADRQLKEQVQGNINLKQMKKLLEQIRDNTK